MSTAKKVDEVVDACRRYGTTSIIGLGGPPGSGKSHIALIAAQTFAGEPTRVKEIQFHQSFSYEEFIEGLRIAKDGSVRPEKGVFLRWNEDAEADTVPGHNYVLLIEEFTRANLSAVLGELLTYVEHRERSFETMFSGTVVKVAPNLVIMATFNPVDRSAVNMDDALLRRLRIIDFLPDEEQLREMLGKTLPKHVLDKLAGVFQACRDKHPDTYEVEVPFGHGVFAEVKGEEDLHPLWVQRLRRLLFKPGQDPHPFADTIKEAYPWHKAEGFRLKVLGGQGNIGVETVAAEEEPGEGVAEDIENQPPAVVPDQ